LYPEAGGACASAALFSSVEAANEVNEVGAGLADEEN